MSEFLLVSLLLHLSTQGAHFCLSKHVGLQGHINNELCIGADPDSNHGMLNLKCDICDHGMRLLEDDTCDHGNVSKDAKGGDVCVR